MIAYLTFDDVNPVYSAELANKVSPNMAFRTINSPDLATEGDLLVYDLDFLPREWREDLLRRAAAGKLTGDVAAHSYNLSADEVRVLRSAGVRISRRLSPSLFATDPISVSNLLARNDRCTSSAVAV